MKRVTVCLVLAIASVTMAGNTFTDASGDHSWGNAANWSMGVVPDSSTTDPSAYVPQWGNDCGVGTNAAMAIGDGETRNSFSLQIGLYGEDNASVTMGGGTLNIGGWGFDVGRGNSNDHGTGDGKLNMTGGTINVNGNILVPQEWRNTGVLGSITGLINMSGGVINAQTLRIGMFDGPGTVNLGGSAVMNLSGALQMDTGWGGWAEPDSIHSGTLNISGAAALKIATTLATAATELQQYQDYIDLGWITSNSGPVSMSVNTDNTMITIVPEPATMLLLGLGGLLIRRKK